MFAVSLEHGDKQLVDMFKAKIEVFLYMVFKIFAATFLCNFTLFKIAVLVSVLVASLLLY